MVKFRETVGNFLHDKLGPVDHKALVNQLMEIADVNKDAKVIVIEMSSVWE